MTVTTVLGDIADDELGLVLPHEHLIADATGQWEMPSDLDELRESLQPLTPDIHARSQRFPMFYRNVLGTRDPLTAVEELQPFVDGGGRTVVELSPPGFGRDPVALTAISRLTGVNVVMGCGEYVGRSHSTYVRVSSVEQIRDMIVSEIEHGVGETGIRPGIIGEIGSGNPVSEAETKVLRAAAQAQMASGLALNIHRTVFPDPDAGLHALDIVLAEGVDPARVVMSHCDERPEPEFALEIGRRGAYIELDTFGMEHWASNWHQRGHKVRRSFDIDRVELVKRVLDAGYVDQLLVSQDVCMQTMLRRNGGGGYAHITENVEERLRDLGVSDAAIAQIRVENPRRMLSRATT
jgi:phosphotriesterase-related protein